MTAFAPLLGLLEDVPDHRRAEGKVYRLPVERHRAGTPRYAVGLYRVSTAVQGQSGLGLEAQQAAVRAFVASQGWYWKSRPRCPIGR